VHATNAVDSSVESDPSNSVTPLSVPGAPTGVSAVRHNLSAEVFFTAPADNGGTAVTGYTVTSTPGDKTRHCLSSPCTVEGLANGTPYTFTVVATNAVGDSIASEPSSSVTPATVPNAPTGVSAVRGPGSAAISFTAPTDNGGSQVTNYTVTSSPDGHSATCEDSPCTVEGLTNGTPYTFTVIATNAVGDSTRSAASDPVTPATVPSAPTEVSATGGNTTAVVRFTASADNGGAAITSYVVTSSPGGVLHACPSGSPCTITGLTNGTAYTFTVHAVNDLGPSAESAPSAAVTPMTKPSSPTDVAATRGDHSATVTFTVPADGGSEITGYTVTTQPGGATKSCSGPTTCTVTSLTNGTSYTFTVHATN
jgi:hypothetical protein